jgi:hypothetical protein
MTMQRLARVNRTQAFLATLALVLVGLFAPGWYGVVVLFALVAALLVLLVRTAPAGTPGTIALRFAILGGLVVVALYKVL